MEKKYILTDETKTLSNGSNGILLHRIKAIRSFGNVKEGDLGGWIEKEDNLSHEGDCWVCDNAKIFGNSKVYDDAQICGDVQVFDNAKICGYAYIWGNAKIYGNAIVYNKTEICGNSVLFHNTQIHGNAEICGNAIIQSSEDYIVFKNWWSSGRYFTWTRSNNMWRVGCFYGTGEELIKKAYEDSEISGSENSGREYERIVKYVESILKDEEK